jgi:hypothetical protein
MKPHMKTASRTREEDDYREISGILSLRPFEKPPVALPFVSPGNPCPKCNYTDRIIWYYNSTTRCRVVECRCGYYKEQFTTTYMPMTPEEFKGLTPAHGGLPLIELTCPTCGKVFRKQRKTTSTLCQRCRNNTTYREWRKTHPEQYKQTQDRHQGLIKEKQARARELAKEFV